MMCEPLRRLTLVAVLLAMLVGSARAQQGSIDKRLKLSVSPKYGALRGHAPIALTVHLRWAAAELIEGRLQLEWFVDSTHLGTYVSQELALAESAVEFAVVLPPVMLSHDEANFSVRGKLLTDRGVYDLDIHDVMLQPDWRRILLLGVCREEELAGMSYLSAQIKEQGRQLPAMFQLEPFFANRLMKRELMVDWTDVDPSEVPTEAIRMTAFDVFAIPAESLPLLKPRQLDALARWVGGGGSVCVFVDSSVPKEPVQWLNRLAGRDVTEAYYLRDADGKVVPVESQDDGMHHHRLSLGRAVVVLGDVDAQSMAWKEALLFLWKVRSDRSRQAAFGDAWRAESRQLSDGYDQYVSLEPRRLWRESSLTDLLLPESVRGLSIVTVSLILVLFLLAIGPGDYLLLGWLRRRKWTWVLFPALSLLFTGYTMWAARQQLGEASYARSITIVDIGDDGQPVRTSRFEMLYSATNREEVTEQQRAVMCPMDPNDDRLVGRLGSKLARRDYETPWVITGSLPRNYRVHRGIQQWAPRMARITHFGLDEESGSAERGGAEQRGASSTLPLNEASISAADVFGERSIAVLTARFQPQSKDVAAFLLRKDDMVMLTAPQTRFPGELIALAQQVTRRPAKGFFSVVSQISPTASGNWQDLSLLDPSDAQQAVVVILSPDGEGSYTITRRLFVQPTSSTRPTDIDAADAVDATKEVD